jgi:hypothetical protein
LSRSATLKYILRSCSVSLSLKSPCSSLGILIYKRKWSVVSWFTDTTFALCFGLVPFSSTSFLTVLGSASSSLGPGKEVCYD